MLALRFGLTLHPADLASRGAGRFRVPGSGFRVRVQGSAFKLIPDCCAVPSSCDPSSAAGSPFPFGIRGSRTLSGRLRLRLDSGSQGRVRALRAGVRSQVQVGADAFGSVAMRARTRPRRVLAHGCRSGALRSLSFTAVGGVVTHVPIGRPWPGNWTSGIRSSCRFSVRFELSSVGEIRAPGSGWQLAVRDAASETRFCLGENPRECSEVRLSLRRRQVDVRFVL
jgi:hypothetical protein